jgi:hypothetical protein
MSNRFAAAMFLARSKTTRWNIGLSREAACTLGDRIHGFSGHDSGPPRPMQGVRRRGRSGLMPALSRAAHRGVFVLCIVVCEATGRPSAPLASSKAFSTQVFSTQVFSTEVFSTEVFSTRALQG